MVGVYFIKNITFKKIQYTVSLLKTSVVQSIPDS